MHQAAQAPFVEIDPGLERGAPPRTNPVTLVRTADTPSPVTATVRTRRPRWDEVAASIVSRAPVANR